MRVFELAQTLKTTSADVLQHSAALGLDVRSPLSRLDDAGIRALQSHFTRRSAETVASENAARQAKLQAKHARATEMQQVTLATERERLQAAIACARKIDAQLHPAPGVAVSAPAAVDVAAAPAPIETAPPTEPVAEAPVVPDAAVPAEPPAPVVAEGAAPAEPTDAESAEAKAAAAAKPRKAFVTAEKDIDEELEAVYVGKPVRPAIPARAPAKQPLRSNERDRRAPPRPMPASARGRPAPMAPGRGAPLGRSASTVPTAPASPSADRVLTLRGPAMVKELAEMMGLRPNRLIADLMQLNVLASINQRVELDMAGRIAEKYGYRVELERPRRSGERKPVLKRDDADDAIPDDPAEDLMPRPPVVTFLGHVDHGKTSLMDRIRNTTVAAGESGGITQHIGAYTVDVNGRKITFLDTPGHAAFSAMRARGAHLTDIAVIIIAADDGIMPQTREAIRHARQASVQLLVAINKCDLPQAQPDRVRQQLQGEGLTPEEWGGDIVCCEVSAINGKGVDHLLEMILLQADVLELRANPNRRADGLVIEAQLEQGRGPTATLLVVGGTLNVGDIVLCGEHFGRIRGLTDDRGRMIKSAGPGVAVRMMGLSGVPEAGAQFRVMLNEKRARDLAEKSAQERKEVDLATPKVATLDEMMRRTSAQNKPDLSLIVKGDTQGSVEAIVDSLREIKSEKVTLTIVNSGIGNVTHNDVQRAAAGHATIIGFHAGCESGVQALARHDGVRIQTFRIIYELFDYVKLEMLGLLAPEYRETIRGHAQIRVVFGLGKKGKVAGCQMQDGVLRMDSRVRVVRDKVKVFDGRLLSLYHFQNEVSEVKEQQECGARFDGFESFAEGDIIECYSMQELERTL